MSKLLLIFTLAAAVIGGGYQFKDRLFPDRHTQAITRTLVAPSQSKAQTVPSALDYGVLNQALRRHVIEAEQQALGYARQALDDWHASLMRKVDENFLNWYFGYWRQQGEGLKYAWNAFWQSETQAEQELLANISREFENRVTPPQLLDKQIQAIATDTVQAFIDTLSERVTRLPEQYQIPPHEWEEYLAALTVTLHNLEANRSTPLEFKALMLGATVTTAGVALPLVKITTPLVNTGMAKLGMATGAKLAAGKAVAGAGAKLGAAAVGKGGSMLGGPVIFVIVAGGLSLWEAFDHNATVQENKPLMRQQISEYLAQFEADMLHQDGPIGLPLYTLKVGIVQALQSS